MTAALRRHRLQRQGIATPIADSVGAAVGHLGAMQAQDYAASLWAIGLRTAGATLATVEASIARGEIVRTWPMRGTLHWLAREDVRWMVALMAPRVQAANAARIARDHGLDAETLGRCRRAIEAALSRGRPVKRGDLYACLDAIGVDSGGQRGLHVLGWMAQEGLICQGPREGRQPTFVWLDAWIPAAASLDRDEALQRLALRYLQGHAPATAADLAWWSGLTQKDAKRALDVAASQLQREPNDDDTLWHAPALPETRSAHAIHLLPAFDEYVIGYRNRAPVVDNAYLRRVIGINGLVSPTIIVEGRVVGTWKREADARGGLRLSPFRTLQDRELAGIAKAAARLGRFLGAPTPLLS
ncbi:winged helix DNA-binding domain-containing protein [Pseudoxanthomonas sp. LjRoot125]|uniref:winged helix DNA-binding domain-containing protein n=1 Tax=Pseudoxanthomonas sp. LjRoot125 TaxID=3342258 RepID=UPI003E1208DE